MTIPTDDEIANWLLSHAGLSGRSPDPAVRQANAALLMPHDPTRQAMSTLDHWTIGGVVHVMSTCALRGMAYARFLGLTSSRLERPYLGHNDAPAIVEEAWGQHGAWLTSPDDLATMPDAGDVVRIGTGTRLHYCCVARIDAPTSALVCVDGGQGDGSLIAERRRLVIVWRGLPYLVDAMTPWDGDGSPNGRVVSGRGGIAALRAALS